VSEPARFDRRSEDLRAAVASHPELTGLVMLGSAAEEGRHRRDEWSDHDFFAIAAEGRGAHVRGDLSWLPGSDHLAATAREGDIGFVALYDDGHVFEFALAEIGELSAALAEEATVVLDTDGAVAGLVADATARAVSIPPADAVTEVTLFLVKILIGVGRARRGEVLTAGQFVRTWAVQGLVRAVRARDSSRADGATASVDPVRRFEADHPAWAAQIATALEQPVEDAARALYDLVRMRMEPGWPSFPSRAADAVAARLGWRGHARL
jgi:hypothetical protein